MTLTLVMGFTYPQSNMTEVPLVVGIRPDVLPDERFVPGPLPLLSEGVLLTGVYKIHFHSQQPVTDRHLSRTASRIFL